MTSPKIGDLRAHKRYHPDAGFDVWTVEVFVDITQNKHWKPGKPEGVWSNVLFEPFTTQPEAEEWIRLNRHKFRNQDDVLQWKMKYPHGAKTTIVDP